ncbi:MAG: hypothetical protein HF314_02615 [Ignavibacteria bacterium]|jgi:hypothetical protein|nr:hypothetical protein [Ignavibacteria bacterium]MCU7501940.1 hypothetical protein [Ignavibacteria bacterium]MCU7514714.1 hypothetical protein [Ignavibacteria bacterium]
MPALPQTDEMPGILPRDVPSGKITRNDFFDGKSLWGYIDGGADLYLEYGFSRLRIQEISFKEGQQIKLEIYRMKDPAAAYGIFSVSRFKCSQKDSLSRFSCISGYQVQAACGRYYVSAINENGTLQEQELCCSLVRLILGQIKEDSLEFPGLFQEKVFQPYINELKFFNGKLGVQNGFPAWSDQFDRYGKFSMYLLPIETPSGFINASKIKFSSDEDMKSFYENAGFLRADSALCSINREGVLKAVKKTAPLELVYFESNFPSGNLQEFIKAID